MCHFQTSFHRFLISINQFRQTQQWYRTVTETTVFFRTDVTFFFPERIEHSYQGRTLPREIRQAQQLESTEVFCTQSSFNISLITQSLQFSRSQQEAVSQMCHTVFGQCFLEYLKITRTHHPVVFGHFLEVGIYTPLPDFVAHHRLLETSDVF